MASDKPASGNADQPLMEPKLRRQSCLRPFRAGERRGTGNYKKTLLRYSVAILLVAAAAGVRAGLLASLGTHAPFVTFYPAVIVAALYGGLYPGLLAAVLSTGAAAYWLEPFGRLSLVQDAADWLGMSIYLASAIMVSCICEAMRRARARVADAEAQAKLAGERKQRELAVQRERAFLRHVIDAAPSAIMVKDLESRYVIGNEAVARFLGTTVEGLTGKTDWELLASRADEHSRAIIASEQAAINEEDRRVIESRVEARSETSVTGADGQARWFTNIEIPWVDEDGSCNKVLIVATDITVRKQTEEALRESEARYRAIGESIDYGVWVCAPDGRNIYASESFLKLVGQTQQQCSDYGWGEVLHPEDAERTIAAWKECVRTGGTWDIEHRFRGVDGQWHPILARGVAVRDEQGAIACWAGINLDISKLKKAEEELRKAKDEMEQRVQERTAELTQAVDRLQNEVVRRSIAEQSLHERSDQLRLLASELTLAEQRERQRLAQILHDGLQQILVGAKFRLALIERSKNARQMTAEVADLIDDAIETSRSLTAELSPPILRQGGLVPALEWLVRWMHNNHGMTVDLLVPEQVEPASEEMTVFLFQATRELLFNVAKHAGTKTAWVQVTRLDDQIQVSVEDRGVGFDPSQLRAEGGPSGGIGLFSIRERVNLLGGRMKIESAPGRGSRFRITAPVSMPPNDVAPIPADRQAKAPVVVFSPREHKAAGKERRIRIMLVDDHVVMRQGLAGLLRTEPDMEIVGEASDGEAAVKLVREIRPDVVLMDISMPGLDGIQATRIIHADQPEVSIIGLSMFQEGDQAAAMREAGAVAYLAKSGPAGAVIAAVRSCVRASHEQLEGKVP